MNGTSLLAFLMMGLGFASMFGPIEVVGPGAGELPFLAIVIGFLMLIVGGASGRTAEKIRQADADGDVRQSVGYAGLHMLITGAFAILTIYMLLGAVGG